MNTKLLLMATLFSMAHDAVCASNQVITFFVRRYPISKAETHNTAKFKKKLDKPGELTRQIAKHSYFDNNIGKGIFAFYRGFVTVSDQNKQITFPRRGESTKFEIIVTPKIEPVIMFGNTVHHWIIPEKTPSETYIIERKQDPETELYFWAVSKETALNDNRIPLNGIVIMAKPQNIYIPSGITVTSDSPQLVLPPIYAKKEIDTLSSALSVLTFKRFFTSIKSIYKVEGKSLSSIISNA